ncbi:SAM domain-containing protein [Phlyctema vagabunda]|uniref:SAM domain-containing protein n=1 Tax=Phlyctema vagabunda TaxID=108571 RepID=A0ABR4PHK1_9HELO
MASQVPTEPQGSKPRPEVGQILVVIHDFSARSSDELTLAKGDRVELIERDDDFGDGWYLGRHLANGNNGLFPEVYTRLAPRGPSYPLSSFNATRPYPVTVDPVVTEPPEEQPSSANQSGDSTPVTDTDRTTPERNGSISAVSDAPTPTSTLPTLKTQEPDPTPSIKGPSSSSPSFPKALSMTSAAKSHGHGQDSPVMNETLSVIDEHITDMKSPPTTGVERRNGNDSGSEYSSHVDQRLSYINGEETDEEEELVHTREEVVTWSPDQVAEYLFTSGVESKHCEVFRDQEITGDVLLEMDQASVFLKEFDLGSVGRRLKTWQKIKVLQDEVNGTTRRNTQTWGSDVGSDEVGRSRSRSSTSNAMLPRIPSLMERPGSHQNSRLSQQRNNSLSKPLSPSVSADSQSRPPVEARPSAASIRDLHHSRQNSVSQEFGNNSIMSTLSADQLTQLPIQHDTTHKKQASFDRNWTMGGAAPSPVVPRRPLSSAGPQVVSRSSTADLSQNAATVTNLDALDRGYFSGGELEGRQRNVLRKRGSTAHSRNSSYTDEQRLRSATAHSRHSRFGSVDSMRDSPPPSASQKYYGLSVNGRRRAPSVASIEPPARPLPPPKDTPSPIITKMEAGSQSTKSPGTRNASDWLLPVKPLSQSRHFGLRAISDAVTGNERSRVTSPTEPTGSSVKDSLDSPSRTGSSTPSGGPSLDLDSPDPKSPSTMTTAGSVGSKSSKKKTKKETSAYTRGLEKKSPKEQIPNADYSGWMKKKSTNIMTTWKPRLFVLKGRRLSYYYSEDDQEEKGLIDISFHRVLPADTDRLTGLHATLTGATTSPTTPSGSHTQTSADVAAAAEPESTLSRGSDSMFIFKLVPPRAGLSRAVTFTKPTVHYFAVPNIKQGRLWMAALMKATIDRDDSKAIVTTYQQKTISLAKARQMRHRPPALMNLDEHVDEEAMKTPASDKNGLNIQGIIYDQDPPEGDSGVSGILNPDGAKPMLPPQKTENSNTKTFSWDGTRREEEMATST